MTHQMPLNLSNYSKAELEDWLKNFDTIFCDCDGVIYAHETPFPLANDAINKLVDLGKKIYLVTNGSQVTRENMLEKCEKMNFNLPLESMICTSYAAALYLKQIELDKKIYVLGTKAMGKDLSDAGIEHFGIGNDVLEGGIVNYVMKDFSLEEDVGAVLVGFDANFSYLKLLKASNYLANPDVKFFTTNTDNAYQFPFILLPETGPIVTAIENATGRKATVIGKPSTFLYDVIAATNTIDPKRSLMIGDRIEQDIVFGKNIGMKTLLVESGMNKLKDVEEVLVKANDGDAEAKKMIPDFFIPHIGDIFKILTK